MFSLEPSVSGGVHLAILPPRHAQNRIRTDAVISHKMVSNHSPYRSDIWAWEGEDLNFGFYVPGVG